MGELNEFAQTYAGIIRRSIYGCGVVVTDSDSIIAVSKISKKGLQRKKM